MIVKTEINECKLKRKAPLKHLYLYNDEGDLLGFQTNLETLFLQVSVTIWHLSIRECTRKKVHVHFWKSLAKELKLNNYHKSYCETMLQNCTGFSYIFSWCHLVWLLTLPIFLYSVNLLWKALKIEKKFRPNLYFFTSLLPICISLLHSGWKYTVSFLDCSVT